MQNLQTHRDTTLEYLLTTRKLQKNSGAFSVNFEHTFFTGLCMATLL